MAADPATCVPTYLPTYLPTHLPTYLGVRVCERVAHPLPFEPCGLEVAECGKVLQIAATVSNRAQPCATVLNVQPNMLRRTRSMD